MIKQLISDFNWAVEKYGLRYVLVKIVFHSLPFLIKEQFYKKDQKANIVINEHLLKFMRENEYDLAYKFYKQTINDAILNKKNKAFFFTCENPDILEERTIALNQLVHQMEQKGWHVLKRINDKESLKIQWKKTPFTWFEKIIFWI